MMLHRLCPACSTSLTRGRVLTPLPTFTPLARLESRVHMTCGGCRALVFI